MRWLFSQLNGTYNIALLLKARLYIGSSTRKEILDDLTKTHHDLTKKKIATVPTTNLEQVL